MKTRAARVGIAAVALVSIVACGSGGSSPAPPPTCDQKCMDSVALRSLRDAIKLLYNVTLQGKPVGAQDQSAPCPLGGSARVVGTATSNADQGTTFVSLSYVFSQCAYSQQDTDPNQTFSMTLDGTVQESGTIAVQPSSTTALQFQSSGVTFSGTVYDPPIEYQESGCMATLGQNGNDLSGTMCGRAAGLTL